MIFIDTHTHLFTAEFDEDRHEIVQAAIEAGVSQMLLPNIDVESIPALHQLSADFPNNCLPMMGLHPCSVKHNWEADLEIIRGELFSKTFVAVGEIGMDLHWDKGTKDIQQKAFAQQIEWAKELDLPIVIHVRDAFEETFEVVDQLNDERLRGVFHCFTGSVEQAEHIIDYGGFKMGLGGVLTFKNSGLGATVAEIDLGYFVLETDSPYLAPTPNRGKRNESSYITYVADRLAEVKGIEIEEVAEITTANAKELFRL